METVVPSILPLKLNAVGAPNWALGLIMITVPNFMNTAINPFASFRSDRFRSKWGRRIPFLAGATPFLVLFLILLGYSEPISRWVQSTMLNGKGSSMAVVLVVIGVLMVCFQFFNLFITSIYYYLFNDVVPHAFLARFMALFRIVGTCAGGLYNYFVFKYAYTHMQEIFLGAAVLYLIAFTMMCWKVREGDYPPPPPNVGNQNGFIAALRTYGTECFTHRFYWFFFLANTFAAMTWATGSYSALIATKIVGISMETFGKINGITSMITMLLLYPAGMFSDRLHPLRVYFACAVISVLLAPISIAFYFTHSWYSAHTALLIFISLTAIHVPLGALHAASELPMFMKLLPKERYGQFSSANALIRSAALIVAGVACGSFLDLMKRWSPVPDECYRFVPIWNITFMSISAVFLYLLHREWQRLGGMASYQPPRPDLPDSAESIQERPKALSTIAE
jgi:Na+/melibiose symporter-like transporter